MDGRAVTGLAIRGATESTAYLLPTLLQNDMIPDCRDEVATKDALEHHPELRQYAHNFSPLDADARVTVLIGRDGGDIMVTATKRASSPIIHHTALGWAVVGCICPVQKDRMEGKAIALKTKLELDHEHYSADPTFPSNLRSDVFLVRKDDEMPGPSTEDIRFMDIVQNMTVNEQGNIEAPLPLKFPDAPMPSNKNAVFLRQRNSLIRLSRDKNKMTSCTEAMGKMLLSGHVERVPPEELSAPAGEVWYLPVFPVVHPRKKVRLVFDSAATYSDTSLNSRLLQGPDQNNLLRGVLMRFREEEVGFIADVESMFHCFYVPRNQRDLMRFFWYKDNDPNENLVEYRAKVHIFGNRSSPAVAILCLRKAAQLGADAQRAKQREIGKVTDVFSEKALSNAQRYIARDFYVDDALSSAATVEEAVALVQSAREMLAPFNIRLHKIASSHEQVSDAFPPSDRAPLVQELTLNESQMHRALGVAWNLIDDCFVVKVDVAQRPFTKRGIVSIINSIFDPLGIASPVMLHGRLLQRIIMKSSSGSGQCDWDDVLSSEHLPQWRRWLSSLQELHLLSVPRCYKPRGFGASRDQTLLVYSDASQDAIGYVMYLVSTNYVGDSYTAFVRGDSKVAPRAATSIPRLELCAAAEAAMSAQQVISELNTMPDDVVFCSDSKVVLGYIRNSSTRFSQYVSRRLQMILCVSKPEQWRYVESALNPADVASRPTTPRTLMNTAWLRGPSDFVRKVFQHEAGREDYVPLEQLPEQVTTTAIAMATITRQPAVFDDASKRIGSWTTLLAVVVRVLTYLRKLKQRVRRNNRQSIISHDDEEDMPAAAMILVRQAQDLAFADTMLRLRKGDQLPLNHPMARLAPFLDRNGVLRVGGRLNQSDLPENTRHPCILPYKHPISHLILSHYHAKCQHQGRHVTLGTLRMAGFFLERCHRALRDYLRSCVTCRRLRATCESQQMADLPSDRTEVAPPFTNVGLDVAGPWLVGGGPGTRRTSALKKAWVLLFTCLASRAVHVEIISAMDASTFVNAFRRFLAIRGPCKVIRSDRGTNFVAGSKEVAALDMKHIKNSLEGHECRWILNPPHASHFGGVWERKIGQLRSALNAALLQLGRRNLSFDELHTLLQEAAAVVNGTPLWGVSADPNDEVPLTPAMLLTMKLSSEHDVASGTTEDLIAYGTRRWRRVQYLADQFWTRWRRSYLQELQSRTKWTGRNNNLEPGDLVLIKEKNLKRSSWPTGRVEEVKRSADGLVRSVVGRSADSKVSGCVKVRRWERPVTDLVLLIKCQR